MLAFLAAAHAASLDNLEIGGPWGTPAATDATAAWWNPAGLAAGRGTRVTVEGAPTFAAITFQRAEPNGGTDIYMLSGVVPYLGLATDAGARGLGLGVGVAVPTVRGGAEDVEPGAGAWHMRAGEIRALRVMAGGGYEIANRVAFGAAVHVVRSSWTARVDTDTLPDLKAAIEAEGEATHYTDADLENPDYAATLQFDELSDVALSFSAGARVRFDPGVTLAVAYVHGAEVDNTGGLTIQFGCPPESDTTGRYAAERADTCYAEVGADASIAYTLPERVHGAVMWEPNEVWALTAMGGWVRWSVFQDFAVTVTDPQIAAEEGQALITQSRKWARANVDSGWAGLDVKARLHPAWTVGGRLLYDGAAVPTEALSTNNYDADAWMLSAMAAWRPKAAIEVGASWTHHFLAERTVEESGFGQTIEGAAPDDRWNYPHAAGVYSGAIDRVGVAVRLHFGGDKPKRAPDLDVRQSRARDEE